jgi:DNA excision repair protein ERCC-3
VVDKVVEYDCKGNMMILHPTLVVMPCGSGKTFTSLCCIATVRQCTLIITNYKIVALQWKKELLKYFNIKTDQIQCISDESFEYDYTNPPSICIITYDTLTSSLTSSSRLIVFKLLMTNFGLIILDEAHKSVAPSYYCVISKLSGTFVAFTATPIREDSELKQIFKLVHSDIEIGAHDLVNDGYIAEIICTTVFVPTNPILMSKTLSHTEKLKAAVVNPNKIAYLIELLATMTENKERILIFCDDIWSLKYVFSIVKQKYQVIGPIYMDTSLQQRETLVCNFLEEDDKYKLLMISRTGDEGLDIPCASKLIQICTSWGSRRQHAQRIGRIQRAHDSTTKCEAITIVSKDTIEVKFAHKRDKYIKEMKYKMNTIDIKNECEHTTNLHELVHSIKKSGKQQHKHKPKKTSKKSTPTNNLQMLKIKLNKRKRS